MTEINEETNRKCSRPKQGYKVTVSFNNKEQELGFQFDRWETSVSFPKHKASVSANGVSLCEPHPLAQQKDSYAHHVSHRAHTSEEWNCCSRLNVFRVECRLASSSWMLVSSQEREALSEGMQIRDLKKKRSLKFSRFHLISAKQNLGTNPDWMLDLNKVKCNPLNSPNPQ